MALNGPNVLVGAFRDRPATPLLNDRDQPSNRCLKNDFAFLSCCKRRVSVDTQAGPSAPEVVETDTAQTPP